MVDILTEFSFQWSWKKAEQRVHNLSTNNLITVDLKLSFWCKPQSIWYEESYFNTTVCNQTIDSETMDRNYGLDIHQIVQ